MSFIKLVLNAGLATPYPISFFQSDQLFDWLVREYKEKLAFLAKMCENT